MLECTMRVLLPDLPPFRALSVPGVTPLYFSNDHVPPDDAEGFVLWFLRADLRREVLRRDGLKWVLTLTAGVDHVLADLPPGVALYNAHALHDRAVAQHAVALLLAAGRGLHRFRDAQQGRVWADDGPMHTLEGRSVVIWGYGHIGRLLEGMLAPLGARVTGLTSRSTPTDIETALRAADDVVLLLPRTPATRHILNAGRLAQLRSSAWVYNLGRGELIDPDALNAALEAEELAGAALDVTEPEPLPASSPLWTRPNVIITPHVGSTTDDLILRGAQYAEKVLDAMQQGQDVPGRVEVCRGY